jgi:hypothetical protein
VRFIGVIEMILRQKWKGAIPKGDLQVYFTDVYANIAPMNIVRPIGNGMLAGRVLLLNGGYFSGLSKLEK